jgi:hypothetical protein
MYDKFVRDIVEMENVVVVDKSDVFFDSVAFELFGKRTKSLISSNSRAKNCNVGFYVHTIKFW